MLVLYNARIPTQDPARPAATAMAIENGRVLMTGSDAEITSQFSGPKQDLLGRTVWPGLTDAHIHLEQYAFALEMIDCETATHDPCANTSMQIWITRKNSHASWRTMMNHGSPRCFPCRNIARPHC